MNQCQLCDTPAHIQSYYCVECGKICHKNNCGKPAAWSSCGQCQKHYQEECKATDFVMYYVDTAFCDGRFDEVNEKLKTLDVSTMSSVLVITWLTCSKWAEEKLSYRAEFFKKCYDRLVKIRGVETANKLTRFRGVDEEIQELIKGLEMNRIILGDKSEVCDGRN